MCPGPWRGVANIVSFVNVCKIQLQVLEVDMGVIDPLFEALSVAPR